MKLGNPDSSVGAKAARLSDSEFGVAVHSRHNSLGNLLLGAEPVEDFALDTPGVRFNNASLARQWGGTGGVNCEVCLCSPTVPRFC
jgi:hypothetical protein